MADKKVDRFRAQRTLSPTQSTKAVSSGLGAVGTVEAGGDERKSALLDKFRKREERWRREQSFHDRETDRLVDSGMSDGTDGEALPGEGGAAEGGGR